MGRFSKIFELVKNHLDSKGVVNDLVIGKPVVSNALLQKIGPFSIPKELEEYYKELGNGAGFSWHGFSHGKFSIPSYEELLPTFNSYQKNVAWKLKPGAFSKCMGKEHHQKARMIVEKMVSWVPIKEEGNGDCFCLDLSSGKVVFDKHDWFDGFDSIADTNGAIAGDDLLDYARNAGRFCFSDPISLYWPDVISGERFTWDAEAFEPDCLVTSL